MRLNSMAVRMCGETPNYMAHREQSERKVPRKVMPFKCMAQNELIPALRSDTLQFYPVPTKFKFCIWWWNHLTPSFLETLY